MTKKNISVVIGSAYGDEGKGLFTDYLTSLPENKDSVVVRFNGGAQAGHTVTTPDNKRHVFGSLASGAFNNKPSFLSSFFVFNPLIFMKEKAEFESKSICPPVYINGKSYLSTPFDMILNQLVEIKRGNANHGSCGLGFGESIQRCENSKYTTCVSMLKDIKLLKYQISLIQKEYLLVRAQELQVAEMLNEYSFMFTDNFKENFIVDYLQVATQINIIDDVLPPKENLVFEGAQGLLLDQNLGFFPHVTRSNTGLKNVVQLVLEDNKNGNTTDEINIIYATRCYTTRHGAGPLKNALNDKAYPDIIDNTNSPNQFQGTLRFAYIDLDVLNDTIKRDIKLSNIEKYFKFNYKIGISCLDQTKIVKFYENNILKQLTSYEFAKYVKNKLQVDVLTSYSPTREKIYLI